MFIKELEFRINGYAEIIYRTLEKTGTQYLDQMLLSNGCIQVVTTAEASAFSFSDLRFGSYELCWSGKFLTLFDIYKYHFSVPFGQGLDTGFS